MYRSLTVSVATDNYSIGIIVKMGLLKMDNLRIGHLQYIAMILMVLFLSFILYPKKLQAEPNSIWAAFVHFLAFSAQYGSQLWVTLVAGITMFCSLPRRMFGQLQKRLFPLFFFWCYITSMILIITFISKCPLDTGNHTEYTELSTLVISLMATTVNMLVLSPVIVTAMLKTFEIEESVGLGDLIGYANIAQLKENKDYMCTYKLFRKCHAISGSLTVVSLLCNTIYLYYSLNGQCLSLVSRGKL